MVEEAKRLGDDNREFWKKGALAESITCCSMRHRLWTFVPYSISLQKVTSFINQSTMPVAEE